MTYTRREPTGLANETGPGQAAERYGLLMSIQTRFAEAILDGTKTVELRRRPPRDDPRIVIIYSSGRSRSVVGVASMRKVHTSTPDDIWVRFGRNAGVTRAEFFEYFTGSDTATAIELDRAERGSTELPLASLRLLGLEPPQSWRYVDQSASASILEALNLDSAAGRVSHARRFPFTRPTATVAAALVDFTLGGLPVRLGGPLVRLVNSTRCARRGAAAVSPGRLTRGSRDSDQALH